MIITIRRLSIDPRKTVGQMTAGEHQCCTLEKPMPVFHSIHGHAVAAGQYPLILFGDVLHLLGVDGNPNATLGLDIELGSAVIGEHLLHRAKTLELFYPIIAKAINHFDDVLVEIINVQR